MTDSSLTLARWTTRAGSLHSYLIIRWLVDPDLADEAYRAYAYFRWIDDRLDSPEAGPGESLMDVLRRAGKTSVKNGCDRGDCGSCAVLVNGRAVNACLVFAAMVDGAEITTVEGLARDGQLSVYLHEGFWHPMDTYRDYLHLNALWARGNPPWKVWKD